MRRCKKKRRPVEKMKMKRKEEKRRMKRNRAIEKTREERREELYYAEKTGKKMKRRD